MRVKLIGPGGRAVEVGIGEAVALARRSLDNGRRSDAEQLAKAILPALASNKAVLYSESVLSLISGLVDGSDDKLWVEYLVGYYAFHGQFGVALGTLEALAGKYPANPVIHFSKGYVLASLGRRGEAHGCFLQAGELDRRLASPKDISNLAAPVLLPPFRNGPARELSASYSRSMPLGETHFSGGSLLSKIQVASIEISNLCNYSNIHPRCPTKHYKERTILPTELVSKVLEELGAAGFSGSINWGLYTEPLIDPRLVDFIKMGRRLAPKAKNALTTNGFYLTQESAQDLIEAGLDILFVSAYSMAEYIRFLTTLDVPIPYYVYISILSKRIEQNWYANQPIKKANVPKYFPFLLNFSITCRGEVGLCCNDWQHAHTFGGLRDRSLKEIVGSPALQDAHAQLASGKRPLQLCQRCSSPFSTYPYWLLAK